VFELLEVNKKITTEKPVRIIWLEYCKRERCTIVVCGQCNCNQ